MCMLTLMLCGIKYESYTSFGVGTQNKVVERES